PRGPSRREIHLHAGGGGETGRWTLRERLAEAGNRRGAPRRAVRRAAVGEGGTPPRRHGALLRLHEDDVGLFGDRLELIEVHVQAEIGAAGLLDLAGEPVQ